MSKLAEIKKEVSKVVGWPGKDDRFSSYCTFV